MTETAQTEATSQPTQPTQPIQLPLPDRLSADPRSKFHVASFFDTGVGVRLNGKPRTDVEEYCVSEGWVKVPAGKAVDRKGYPLTIKLKGTVEVFYP